MQDFDLSLISKSESFRKVLGISSERPVEFKLLGSGEYNINYLFGYPENGRKMVLRLPMGSQMHLSTQARYEYNALLLLKESGRTPEPLYIDESNEAFPYGFLIMSYLPGKPLVYEEHMEIAAQILSDIHNTPVSEKNHLIRPPNPLFAILEECHSMAKIYLDYDKGSKEVKSLIKELLEKGKLIIEKGKDYGKRCIINTELNSGNFLINGEGEKNYLIDWEKPLYAYRGQDLGHFLAPTTTFWKTDTILSKRDILAFIESYCKYSEAHEEPERLWQSTMPYFAMTCLRGITWCAMAWVEYQSPERAIKNEYTYKKIQEYLKTSFLENIRNEYMV